MKLAKNFFINILIILLSLIFIGISFADFYVITTTGSALDHFTGGFVQSVEIVNNSYISIICAFLPLACLLFKKKWTNVFAILASTLNFLIIVFIYPLLISATSLIGSSHSANLTGLGWIGSVIVLLITLLLLVNMTYKRKAYIVEQKGGKEE